MSIIYINPFQFAAAGPTFLLDDYPGAAAAYSLRQLRTGVTNVVRVRRDNDGVEADFTATEVSDGTLAAWVGAGNNGFVRTWYDQSGNANDAGQTIAANQPQIVSSGNVIQTNNSSALDFNGTSQRMDIPTIPLSMNNFSLSLVSKADSTASQIGLSCPDNNRIYVPFLSSGSYYVGYADSGTKFNFGTLSPTSQYLTQLNAGVSAVNAWRNGAASTPVAPSTAAEVGDNLSIGSYKKGGNLIAFWDGTIQEIILYPSDQSANRAAIEADINAHYSIYP